MKQKLVKICALLFTILLMGCTYIVTILTSRVLEVDDIKPFRIIFNSTPIPEVKLEGALLHSAIVIHKTESFIDGKVMSIVFHGALVTTWDTEKRTGFVDHKFTIPNSVDVIVFGNKKTIIWERNANDIAPD
jgi:hypothetical protein